MPGKLTEYKAKRKFSDTPEPAGAVKKEKAKKLRFVVQEHHARRLHWDFRLERDGVLVSWAVPKGVPPDPKRNHLAVHVEDHPLDYIDFHGTIPQGNYGAGKVEIWDHGTYETLKWQDDEQKGEVMVVLHGKRVQGKYVLFRTRGTEWMIHRMDPPQDQAREEMPSWIEPMKAYLRTDIPSPDKGWAYEFKWDGIRALAFVEGGRVRLSSRRGEDITPRYPDLHRMGRAIGSREVVLDGEVIAVDEKGRPSFEVLQQRMGLTSDSQIRRVMRDVPVTYMIFDLLYDDGHSLLPLPWEERRKRLEALRLDGDSWKTPAAQIGSGKTLLATSNRMGLEGIMCKRVDSPYMPGRRSDLWLKVKNHNRQEFVIGGWVEGEGRRKGVPGALLLGYYDGDRFVYAGKVGTGFTDSMLEDIGEKIAKLAAKANPFDGQKLPGKTHFVALKLVCEVEFVEWTKAGQLRAPSFKGLRTDKKPKEVVRES